MSKIRDLAKEFSHLNKGEQLIYHTGLIVKDRNSKASFGERFISAKRIDKIADYFLSLSDQGKAHLIQTSTECDKSFNHSHYIAIKR